MKYIAAYLLAQIGGCATPDAAKITSILESVGITVDSEAVNAILGKFEGKNVDELIAEGSSKLAVVGGGAAVEICGEVNEIYSEIRITRIGEAYLQTESYTVLRDAVYTEPSDSVIEINDRTRCLVDAESQDRAKHDAYANCRIHFIFRFVCCYIAFRLKRGGIVGSNAAQKQNHQYQITSFINLNTIKKKSFTNFALRGKLSERFS
jgi:ribosomal protein L12E/L44/L45/RPP1/RPP2